MWQNYLTIAARTLRSRPGPTIINVLGLATGLAACLLIGMWVQHEMSYDTFHEDSDRLYRVILDAKIQDRELSGPVVSLPLAPTAQRTLASVEVGTRFNVDDGEVVRVDDRTFSDLREVEADTSFFRTFTFPLTQGDSDRALQETNAVVLTVSTAQRLFGTSDAVGRTLMLDEEVHRVTGIAADPPSTSHIQFDFISRSEYSEQQMSSWMSNSWAGYVKLAPGTPVEAFEEDLNALVRDRAAPEIQQFLGLTFEAFQNQGFRYRYFAQPITDVHLHSNFDVGDATGGSITYVYTFSAIALFILLIACVNFMNLATARASERATEVGVRKSLGAHRGQLAGQFLGEAVLTTAAATILALVLALLALPAFNSLSGTEIGIAQVLSPAVLLGGVLLVGGVGLVSGSYPAFVLSQFRPADVLKAGDRHSTGGAGARLRQGLVVLQFTISIVLIVGTLVTREQFNYIQQKQLGLNTEQVMAVERPWVLDDGQSAFVQRLRGFPEVAEASTGSSLFRSNSNSVFVPDDAPSSASVSLNYMDVEFGFPEALDVELAAGRTFDRSRPADSNAVMINEAAAKMLGWENPLEHTLREPGNDSEPTQPMPVIGVIKNFHYESLRREIRPLLLRIDPTNSTMYVRMNAGESAAGLEAVRAAWNEAVPGEPFQYTFLNQRYETLHRSAQQTGQLFSVFAVLAVLIACLGLFGLATYVAQRRTKEIGIRKALGATVPQIVGLLSRQFLMLVGVAFLVAAPLAYLAMREWLASFAYRTDLGGLVFVLAGLLAVVVAFLTVSTQAWRTARIDPASSLRSE